MSFGVAVWDGSGVQTLGMDDFTIQRLAIFDIPASRGSGAGVRGDYITLDIPGYDPSTCFVTITPKVYSPYPQGPTQVYWGLVPTYRDIGGTQIGIVNYCNYYEVGYDGKWIFKWESATVESVVEVVKVI